METVYANPKYYEVAFSFRDIPQEVDLFEEVIRRYSHVPVSRMLEVASGNAPHLAELAKRGYEYVGLDLSNQMIEYAKAKADEIGAQATFHQGSMVDFLLDEPVDFAFILLGSLSIRDTDELLSHFKTMGRAIRRGGLYLLDWCVSYEQFGSVSDSWELGQEGIQVKTTHKAVTVDSVEQMIEETIILEVDDHGKKGTFEEKILRRMIYPQEFLLFVEHCTDFEFIGWWNNWSLDKPLSGRESIQRPVAVLRRQ